MAQSMCLAEICDWGRTFRTFLEKLWPGPSDQGDCLSVHSLSPQYSPHLLQETLLFRTALPRACLSPALTARLWERVETGALEAAA